MAHFAGVLNVDKIEVSTKAVAQIAVQRAPSRTAGAVVALRRAFMALMASALFMSLPGNFALVPTAEAAIGKQCTNWTSKTEPPPDIAVYQVSEGKVERVEFKLYVARVVSREWNVKQQELRNAGTVAAKQYAWYHVLHWRGDSYNGQCFDVRDTRADQLYAAKPAEEIPEVVWRSVRDTWSWQVSRDGKFIMTGYRRGDDVKCARDAGWKLYARSGLDCVQTRHWDAQRLLEVYYTADLVI